MGTHFCITNTIELMDKEQQATNNEFKLNHTMVGLFV